MHHVRLGASHASLEPSAQLCDHLAPDLGQLTLDARMRQANEGLDDIEQLSLCYVIESALVRGVAAAGVFELSVKLMESSDQDCQSFWIMRRSLL